MYKLSVSISFLLIIVYMVILYYKVETTNDRLKSIEKRLDDKDRVRE